MGTAGMDCYITTRPKPIVRSKLLATVSVAFMFFALRRLHVTLFWIFNCNFRVFQGSRYMLSNRPTVATAPQPSIGTSPRYMVDPERRQEPPSSFDGARVILSRAQSNVDRFELDSRVNLPNETGASEPVYATPQKKTQSHAQPSIRHARAPTQKENYPTNSPRLEMAAMERAELEAQLLVSRALARARTNVRT